MYLRQPRRGVYSATMTNTLIAPCSFSIGLVNMVNSRHSCISTSAVYLSDGSAPTQKGRISYCNHRRHNDIHFTGLLYGKVLHSVMTACLLELETLMSTSGARCAMDHRR